MIRTRSCSSIHTTQARGSRKPWNSRAVLKRVLEDVVAAFAQRRLRCWRRIRSSGPASSRACWDVTSPGALLQGSDSCRYPGAALARRRSSALSSVSKGRSSYSTSISRAAASAASFVSAATAATRSPTIRTRSLASAGQSSRRRPRRTCPISAPVSTACTPGTCCAADVSTEMMRACGRGLRVYASQSMPGMCTSAV